MRHEWYDRYVNYLEDYVLCIGETKTDVLRAGRYAKEVHSKQKRTGGLPYIVHPYFLVHRSMDLGVSDTDILVSLLLHDVVEDTPVCLEELPFNETVRGIVYGLTRAPGECEKVYYERVVFDDVLLYCKLLDRLDNLNSGMTTFKPERLIRYVKKTEYLLNLYRTRADICFYKDEILLLVEDIEIILRKIKKSM